MAHLRTGLTLRVAATYVGTVVGAGFASGQEILRFFGGFGPLGLVGVGLATVMLIGYGILVMELGRRTGARSHREVLAVVCGRRLAPVADVGLSALLLACLGVMLAAGGAIAAEQWGLPYGLGATAMAVLTALTVLAGLHGLMAANGFVVPVLILAVAGLTGATLLRHGLTLPAVPVLPQPAAAPHWQLAALLYAGYNLVLSIAVLAPLGAQVGDRRALAGGGILGGLVLGLLGTGILLALGSHPEAGRQEIPLLYLARLQPRPVAALYTLVLWAEIYTTAIACAFGVTQRLAALGGGHSAGPAGKKQRGQPEGMCPGARAPHPLITVLTITMALALSSLGFSHLVERLYPAFGYLSLAILLLLTLRGPGRGPARGP